MKRFWRWLRIRFDRKMYVNPLDKSKFRNKLCPCKSGYKVKACHGMKKSLNMREWIEINKFWERNKK